MFWLGAVIVVMTAIALYAPTWSFDFVYLDDNNLILNQRRMLQRSSSFYSVFGQAYFPGRFNAYYRPLVNLSLVANYHLGGARPFGYHLVNGLLHAGNCLLVYALLQALKMKRGAALLAALIFAVHPVCVASVAWIPGRNDLLLTGFALGACLLLTQSALRPSAWAKSGHLGCFSAALLCKETAVCLPLVCSAALWAARPEASWLFRRWFWIAWGSLIGLYFMIRASVITSAAGTFADRIHVTFGQLSTLVSDTGKLIVPARLQVLAAPEDILVWPGAVALLGLAGLVLLARGFRRRMLVLAVTMMAGPLLVSLPAAKNVMLENRLYLPTVGLAVLVSECIGTLLTKGRIWAVATGAFASGTIVLLGCATSRYSINFRDRVIFSQAALQASPHSSIARHLRFKSFYPQQLDSMADDR